MAIQRLFLVFFTAVLTLPPALVLAVDDLPTLQSRFDKEIDGEQKVKQLTKLAEAQIAQERKASQANDYSTVGLTFEKYRDNVRDAFDSLKKKRPNASKNPGGYKRLEFENQRALREVKEVLLIAPDEYRPPLQIVLADLMKIEKELLRALFPDRPGEKPIPAKTDKPQSAPTNDPEAAAPKTDQPAPPPQTSRSQPVSASDANDNASSNPPQSLLASGSAAAPAPTEPSWLSVPSLPEQTNKKDYLSDLEADKIRDAETTNDRIKLFLQFADDRLKKFQYELDHPSQTRHKEMLNFLMNAYVGCVDDAADLIQLGVEKQENIRKAIDEMESKTKEFLDVLHKIATDAKEIDTYKDNLDDAIDGTQDALNDATKAKKQVAPGPVRRKQ